MASSLLRLVRKPDPVRTMGGASPLQYVLGVALAILCVVTER